MSSVFKVYRDPIHTNISFDRKSAVGTLAIALIDSPEVQRLRHVRQLALANLVYHGAEHSRFSHTLGVMHLAHRFYCAAALNAGRPVVDAELAVVVASAAMHDIGHPPFSHAVEKVVGVNHEEITAALVRGDTGCNAALRDAGGDALVDDVAAHVTGESGARTASIISSQLDADRMDYVMRDGYHAGVPNSRFDLERILQLAEFADEGVVFGVGSQTAVESYFVARYHLYLQLYYHRTTRAAEVMLRSIIRRAHLLAVDGSDLGVDAQVVDMLLNRNPRASVALNDHDLWSAFRQWATHRDPVLSDLVRRLLGRRLFKVIDMPLGSFEGQRKINDAVRSEAKRRGLDPDFYVVVDEAKDAPYKMVDVSAGDDPQISIRVRGEDGSVFSLETRSGLIKQLQQDAYSKIRLCFPPELRDFVKSITT